MDDKVIIGRLEWCALLELTIPAIRAKVDSGAKTSSIHAVNIEQFKQDNEDWVSFDVHPVRKDTDTIVSCKSKVIDYRNVKSSNGTIEKRFVIRTPITIGDDSWEIELTLTNRGNMGYRMLLGREAMNDHILIDPATKSNLGKVSKKQLKKYYS